MVGFGPKWRLAANPLVGSNDRLPHKLAIDLGDEYPLVGVRCLPCQVKAHGRIREYRIFATKERLPKL